MLTRGKEQILLNEIHALCLEAADHYRAAASKPCVADMEPILLDAARMHENFATELAAYIRTHDDQPKMPDPDRETLEIFFTSIKARLANNERRTLIEDQSKMEEKLCESLKISLECAWPQGIKALLESILANANAMQHILHKGE